MTATCVTPYITVVIIF